MAKEITLGLNYEQAHAEAEQIKAYYSKIDDLGKKAEATMLAICPLLANLSATNGWLHLDNYSSVDRSHDHKSFCKWAEDFFDKPHSTMAETIAVARRYYNDNGTLINDDLSQYGYTQLLRMRKLTDDEIAENITPEMSSADIKRLVVELKSPKKAIQENIEPEQIAIPENLKNLMNDVDVPEDVSRETLEENINRDKFALSEFSDEIQELFIQMFGEESHIITIDMRA